MQIYINDGVWQQVINHTVFTAIISDTGTLLAYKTEHYPTNKSARQAAQRKT